LIPSITAWRRRRSPGENGFYLISSEPFGLIVLDVMLPGRSGLEIPSTARFRGLRTPVLIVTARDAVEDRAVRLDSGPDDYLVKPLAFPELQARVRVLLRRGKNEPVTKLRSGGLEMDLVGRTEVQDGQTLDLTAREFELLEYLIRNHGRVVTREMLARDVWKENARPTPLYNVIDVHIARLRRKIDGPFPRKLVQTVRGVALALPRIMVRDTCMTSKGNCY
jgi:two-component system copper resistance phosphate regulon response regulator CusR